MAKRQHMAAVLPRQAFNPGFRMGGSCFKICSELALNGFSEVLLCFRAIILKPRRQNADAIYFILKILKSDVQHAKN